MQYTTTTRISNKTITRPFQFIKQHCFPSHKYMPQNIKLSGAAKEFAASAPPKFFASTQVPGSTGLFVGGIYEPTLIPSFLKSSNFPFLRSGGSTFDPY